MIIISLIALLLIIILSIVCSNLISQNRQLEQEVGKDFELVQSNEEKTLQIYEFILRKLIHCKSELDRVDKRGSFSSDDEVGFAFKVIQNSIDIVVNELQSIKTDTEENGTQKT